MNNILSLFGAVRTNATSSSVSIHIDGGALVAILVISLVVAVICIVAMWKIFKKAGQAGWKSIIPIYNIIVLLKICGLPEWYIILCFIPIANIYVAVRTPIELARKFGKSIGFGVLMFFFSVICYPILAFGKAQYIGTNTDNTTPAPNNNSQNNPGQPIPPNQEQMQPPTQNPDNTPTPPAN